MYYQGHNPCTTRSLHEINKTSNIIVVTPAGKIPSINVEDVAKQRTIFDPITCFASTSKVNIIQEPVKYQYGKVEIGMPVFMDDTAAVGTTYNIFLKLGFTPCKAEQPL